MPKPIDILNDDEWPAAGFHFELPIRPENTALGVIDVQGYVIDADGHLGDTVQQHSPELQKAFLERVETMVSNIERLLKAFRENDRRVFLRGMVHKLVAVEIWLCVVVDGRKWRWLPLMKNPAT